MNKFIKKTAAVVAAALMTVSSIGAECFAQTAAKVQKTETTVAFNATVAKPTYKVRGAKGVRRVLLTTATSGATIYYTTNGTVPTAKSRKYTPNTFIKLTKKTQIRAIAISGNSKSAIMTKTFNTTTLIGDVTGDGTINSTDYTRLKNYFAGKTAYICKDNADCDGSGGLNKTKDLGVLGQYINEKVSSLPAKYVAPTASVTLTAPTVSQTKIYGGVSISLSGPDSGATYYYTLGGTTPSNTSIKYTLPFTVSKNTSIKVISYKNGQYSSVKTTDINIAKTTPVYTSKDPTLKYEQVIDVELKCSSENSIIYYTTDGTDPRTSTTTAEYKEPISIDRPTTVIAYSRAKGCIDGDLMTFVYNVDAAFTISGTVWDDTPGTSSVSEGRKNFGEPGIEGINVYLMNADSITTTTVFNSAYVKKTVTDKNGNYSFDNLISGVEYKVVFEYNGQKYRGYGSLVDGGNQAIPVETKDMLVTNSGAFRKNALGVWDDNFTRVNNYKAAITDPAFTTYAITKRSYTTATANVDFALISKNYGILDLAMKVEGQSSAGTARKGDRLTYTITLTNNSPMSVNTLKDVVINAYLPKQCTSFDVQVSTASRALSQHGVVDGYYELEISDIIPNDGLAPGKTITIVIVTSPDRVETGDVLRACAEVTSYMFAFPCFDNSSIPNNLIKTYIKEKDEATCDSIVISSIQTETKTKKTITAHRDFIDLFRGGDKEDAWIVVVKNATSNDDAIIGETTGDCITYTYQKILDKDGDLTIYFHVYASGETSGKASVVVYLFDDPKKKVTLKAQVRE